METPPTYIVADDLTGAADSALPFWRAGQAARVVFEASSTWPENPGVLSICTDSRARPETAAAAAVAAVARRLPVAARWYKKIDSTLRGWIGAEARALLAADPERAPVFAPAYPTKGRTLSRDGIYRVHGTPLAETEFAPEISGLEPDSRLAGFLVRHFRDLAPRVRVVPGETAVDLAASIAAIREPALWIGSPGLGIALAGAASAPRPAPLPPSTLAARPIVIAAGSRRTVTQRQLARLQAALAPGHASALLQVPTADFDPTRSLRLADELGQRAAAAVTAGNARGLILTGGDIAAAACRHLGITSADIVGEVEDGLPVLRAGDLVFVTKAGGFGDEHSLVRAYERLSAFLS